ncbi:hypothetical protein PYW08_001881 [Mythimna loreyi]|uniref:Uncharacterized protein n=1 Tax=Mythimna loreyi TaxID=667449 RepID=A0ACC2R9L9_9NEOP|nr:hypothetical protein PYW08_001881 [Mythimna loreyi]
MTTQFWICPECVRTIPKRGNADTPVRGNFMLNKTFTPGANGGYVNTERGARRNPDESIMECENKLILEENVRGLRTKVEEFYIGVSSSNVDLLAITETGLNESICDAELIPPGYTILRCDRADGRKQGGACLVATPRLDVRRIPVPGDVNIDDRVFEPASAAASTQASRRLPANSPPPAREQPAARTRAARRPHASSPPPAREQPAARTRASRRPHASSPPPARELSAARTRAARRPHASIPPPAHEHPAARTRAARRPHASCPPPAREQPAARTRASRRPHASSPPPAREQPAAHTRQRPRCRADTAQNAPNSKIEQSMSRMPNTTKPHITADDLMLTKSPAPTNKTLNISVCVRGSPCTAS